MTEVAIDELTTLLETVSDAVALFELDAALRYMNPTAERVFGATLADARGRPLFGATSTREGAALAQAFERVARGGESERLELYSPSARASYVHRLTRVGAHVQLVAREAAAARDRSARDGGGPDEAESPERDRLDGERRSTRRLENLLAVAGELAAASEPGDIARVVVDEGTQALEASSAGMYELSPDGRELWLARERGLSPELAAALRRIPCVPGNPLVDAILERRAIWFASRAEYARAYPELEARHRPSGEPPLAFCVLPIVVADRAVGCFTFGFHDEGRLTAHDRAYLEVLTSQSAEALRRAQLLTELRDASSLRQAVIEASPAAILLLDADGVVQAWNPAAERMFGWSATEAVGRPLPWGGEAREQLLANLRYVFAGNVLQRREVRRLRATGEPIDVELYAAPAKLTDGRSLCVAIVVDISERKRAERGRKLITDANEALVSSLDLSLGLAKVVGLPLPGFSDFCSVHLLEGSELRVAATSHEEAAPGVPMPRVVPHDPERGGVSRAIATGRPVVLRDVDDSSVERLARSGAHLDAIRALAMRSALSVPLVTAERVLGALTFGAKSRNFDDLDVQLAMELGRHIAMALEKARLYEHADRSRSEAEAANRTKDEFLAMLGHELRNPLAPIATAVELMRFRQPEALVRERQAIERQVAHLSRLVDDLLDVSRITRGSLELRREPVMLADAVARAHELTRPLLDARQHDVSIHVPSSLVVHADPTRLSQIVGNLMSNAGKYTPPGGRIEVSARRDGDAVLLAVRDNGVGIAPEVLPRIFEMFVQAPQPSARTEGGLGLGLTIVRSLVRAHDGTVEARSDGLGKGTELIVRLPVGEAPRAITTPEPPAARLAPGRRVLVVDDNRDAALLLAEYLELRGHEVATAHDGPSAIELARDFLPELGVIDLGLPGMDGYELARHLHAAHAMQLVAVTGYNRASDRARTSQAGFAAHLGKPVALDELLAFVEGRG